MKVRHLYKNYRIVLVMFFAVLAIIMLTAATSEAAPEQSCGFYHQVQRGQTLSEISRYYGVSVQALLRANPRIVNPNVIYAGTWIYIPCEGGQGGRCSHVHYVQYGQTLSQIAWYYRVQPYAIMRANGLHNPNLIYAGTSLCIP